MGTVRYRVDQPERGEPVFVLVESDEVAGDSPREASMSEEIARRFEDVLIPVSAIANAVVRALKSANPGELTVEFGIELGGSAGIPMITKHEGKANLKVQIKWQRKATGVKGGNEA